MPNPSTSEQTHTSQRPQAVHEPFNWLTDEAKNYPMADFIALAMDVSGGVHACLEIVESSRLAQSENIGRDPEDVELPLVTPTDAERLLRFAISATWLLREHAEQRVNWINEQGPRHLQTLKERAK